MAAPTEPAEKSPRRPNSPQTAFAASTSFASASVISSHRKEMFSDSRLTPENAGRQSGAQQPPCINLRSDSAPSPDSPFPPDDCEPPFFSDRTSCLIEADAQTTQRRRLIL